MSRIQAEYERANPKSRAMYERAVRVLAGGVSQTLRQHSPFPLYVERASGSRKWTVDGQELVDYWMGHSALILGHGHPALLEAAAAQLSRGTNFGAVSEPELELAELVSKLIPSAERVRFTGTGSESVHLALRLARAATGRSKYIKFQGHYHGWHDNLLAALREPYDQPVSAGLPPRETQGVVVLPPNDAQVIERCLDEDKDIAAIILEPYGGYNGLHPVDPAWVKRLRELGTKHGIVLIFDEMVSGFRFAPGGYEQTHGVRPDLTTLGKSLVGGFPGAAVAGRADILDLMSNTSPRYVYHGGTWNAFQVSMAVGVATLKLLADGSIQKTLNAAAARLRAMLEGVLQQRKIDATVGGSASIVAIFAPTTAPQLARTSGGMLPATPALYSAFRQALVLNGVDVPRFPSNVSLAHGDTDFELTARAFDRAIQMVSEDDHTLPRRA